MDDPALGEQKRGDLAYLRVYKFKMAKQLTLLGYSYDNGNLVLELLALGSYENFYRDVKTASETERFQPGLTQASSGNGIPLVSSPNALFV